MEQELRNVIYNGKSVRQRYVFLYVAQLYGTMVGEQRHRPPAGDRGLTYMHSRSTSDVQHLGTSAGPDEAAWV